MLNYSRNGTLWIISIVSVVGAVIWFAWPSPVPVDIANVVSTPMEVTVDEEARTRVRKIYVVSAPLTGTLLRVDRDVGDAVTVDQTVVAVMRPSAPSFHDPRLHQELRAALAAANAAVTLADAERRRIEAALNYNRTELARMQSLAREGAVARSTLDKATADTQINEAALASATALLEVRRNERASAASRLQNPASDVVALTDSSCCIQIRAPVTGQILKLIQQSESVVPAGTPLVDIGDPMDLEIVAELLSTDAVQVKQGDPVHIDGWGGSTVEGRVRRIEPAGFLKVSALGIEEQRVRTIVDFTDPAQRWQRLGHDYRVIVHVVVWKAERALTVPVGALFRVGDSWAVFKEITGRARTTLIKVGHRNNRAAEVISGLSVDDRVVLHASDRIRDGVRIAQRE